MHERVSVAHDEDAAVVIPHLTTILDQFRTLWQQTAIIPGHFYRASTAPGRELKMNLGRHWKRLKIPAPARGTGGDRAWQIEIQRPVRVVDDMSTHVTHHTGAEISPAAPVKGMIAPLQIRTVRRGA